MIDCEITVLMPCLNEAETVGYLMRRDPKTFFPKERHKRPADPSQVYPDWVRTGTPYFKRGGIEDLLDYGIAKLTEHEVHTDIATDVQLTKPGMVIGTLR